MKKLHYFHNGMIYELDIYSYLSSQISSANSLSYTNNESTLKGRPSKKDFHFVNL